MSGSGRGSAPPKPQLICQREPPLSLLIRWTSSRDNTVLLQGPQDDAGSIRLPDAENAHLHGEAPARAPLGPQGEAFPSLPRAQLMPSDTPPSFIGLLPSVSRVSCSTRSSPGLRSSRHRVSALPMSQGPSDALPNHQASDSNRGENIFFVRGTEEGASKVCLSASPLLLPDGLLSPPPVPSSSWFCSCSSYTKDVIVKAAPTQLK